MRKKTSGRPIKIDKTEMRYFSRKAYKKLQEVLKRIKIRPSDMDEKIRHTRSSPLFYKINEYIENLKIEAVDKQTHTIPVYLKFKDPEKENFLLRYFLVGGVVRTLHLVSDSKKRPIEMGIHISTSTSVEELQDPSNQRKIEKEIYSVLIHELTHASDFMKPKEFKPGYPKNPLVYYNTPSEIRAFLQQIADEITERPYEPLLSERENFKEALKSSPTWDRVKAYQTAQTKRQTLKGAWLSYQDALRSGALKRPFTLTRLMKPSQLVEEISRAYHEGLLNEKAEFYEEASNPSRLMKHMVEAAKSGSLWDSISFGEYGFDTTLNFGRGEKLEKLFAR